MAETYKAPTDVARQAAYSYEYGVAINTGTAAAPAWSPIRFISGVDPARTPKTQDAATYDDMGADNAPVVGESWTLQFTVQQQRTADGAFLAEVEALMKLTKPTAIGTAASGEFLWYDKPSDATAKPNPTEAFRGVGTVDIKRGNTGNADIGVFNVTITGQGPRKQVVNPYDPATGTLKFASS